jgi:hypothetical protein
MEGLVGRRAALSQPVFVLTPHPHEPIEMKRGTTVHFVTDGPALIDGMEIHVVSILLGGGERLFENLDGPPDYLKPLEVLWSPSAASASSATHSSLTSDDHPHPLAGSRPNSLNLRSGELIPAPSAEVRSRSRLF